MPLFSSNNFIPNAFYLSSIRACTVAWESVIISFSSVLRFCIVTFRYFLKKYVEIINICNIFFYLKLSCLSINKSKWINDLKIAKKNREIV